MRTSLLVRWTPSRPLLSQRSSCGSCCVMIWLRSRQPRVPIGSDETRRLQHVTWLEGRMHDGEALRRLTSDDSKIPRGSR